MGKPLPAVLITTFIGLKLFLLTLSQVLTLIFFKRGPNVLDSSMISAKHLLYI